MRARLNLKPPSKEFVTTLWLKPEKQCQGSLQPSSRSSQRTYPFSLDSQAIRDRKSVV